MTHDQENYDKTSKAKSAFILNNAGITAGVPNLNLCMSDIELTHEEIRNAAIRQETGNGSELLRKNELKAVLINHNMDTLRKIQAYAVIENNNALQESMNYSESTMKRCSDNRLISISHLIHDQAHGMLMPLATYGFTTVNLNDMKLSMEKFMTAVPQEKLETNETISNTHLLKQLFSKLRKQWIKAAKLIELLHNSHPDFYYEYKKVSIVEKSRSNPHSLIVSVKEAGSLTVLPNVNLVLTTEVKSKQESIRKKTAARGGCRYKNLAEGDYTLFAAKAGYREVSENLVIVKGETTTVNLIMEKL